ncbi:hypothetical protein HN358_00210 [Candidatus Uhrbacteria bacterium]|jgi:hypothetical protein|nr:hypothetical protein [Candidatus Uhrbacteria bacterium]MBT7717272.1 hypothetical protein [Candidatus Uhrbacteria bacterium]
MISVLAALAVIGFLVLLGIKSVLVFTAYCKGRSIWGVCSGIAKAILVNEFLLAFTAVALITLGAALYGCASWVVTLL